MLGALNGVDLGTSKTKALAFALDGRVIASAEAEYPLETPEPGVRRAGRERGVCGGDAGSPSGIRGDRWMPPGG